ncbi:hypothetical protein [Bartonella sp. CB189]|uniref:hypothetical protein n=1 Tax=Bartonella sp. CB189 TaxID=3112254 RepID=UPI002F966730
MKIRYFFIAGAVGISLSLALQTSNYAIGQEHTPSITHSTSHKSNFVNQGKNLTIKNKNLHLIEKESSNFNKENIHFVSSSSEQEYSLGDLITKGKNLIYAIFDFFRCLIVNVYTIL